MLQIITTKFYDGAECQVTACDALLFSNYYWDKPITTAMGVFSPLESEAGVTRWRWSYEHRQVKTPGNFSIVRSGTEEVQEQFRLLAIFTLKAYFGFHKQSVEHLCRTSKSQESDPDLPNTYLPRFFDKDLRGCLPEVTEFGAFFQKALLLPRKQYSAVIAALRAFRDALEALDTNIDLAYSILIYALESLALHFGVFTISWDDYDEPVRRKLDVVLNAIEPDTRDTIRATLLDSAHLKLMVRFLRFCSVHVTDNFFLAEAAGIQFAIRKCELVHALRNAYRFRSEYVHALKPIVDQIRHPVISRDDCFRWHHSTFLTVSGLFRLTRHIIREFILRGERVETEKFNWRADLPGVLKLQLAPEYWINNVDSFHPETAASFFTEFMGFVLNKLAPEKLAMEMSPMMEKIEMLANNAKKHHLIPMVCLYWTYHTLALIPREFKRKDWEPFLKTKSQILDECHIYTIAARVFIGHPLEFSLEQCLEALAAYEKSRFSKTLAQLPLLVETAVIVAVANKALETGNFETRESILKNAVLNLAGFCDFQVLLQKKISEMVVIDPDLFMPNLGTIQEVPK